ncbi:MAG: ribosomal protein S18-alanine N-acetyltransferase [Oscillospiraceae bacterium]|nr:ribosomal protein S18-alanine N-acetyltransferase [Oscillospiraceae bacterium]
MELFICDARPEHIPQIEAIERACFSVPWTAEQIGSQLRDGQHEFLAALDESGTVLGYVGMMTVLDEGYIANVAVDPAYRRQGIADRLIARLCEIARERCLSFVTLEARASNAPAIALYEKHGFVPVGLRKAYYERPREDALLMTKTF